MKASIFLCIASIASVLAVPVANPKPAYTYSQQCYFSEPNCASAEEAAAAKAAREAAAIEARNAAPIASPEYSYNQFCYRGTGCEDEAAANGVEVRDAPKE
ncbi:unnamed protein product [Zymoseptoria tritici ST99CH_1E4]|uniref:Uncharacterized protein n=1 Tax=Zymoseptoria tritici ST99CH_1E4 TaxID=1276532 RepID=A0A2H1GNR3_ZYMTR|nr:unnamed protein product [Zymoseptoria tritici ST99CH_1E4]